ncbi:MAG: BMP family ABC transporter substrate-binding protein, partial [Flexilinea flocculi]|nr:BMP family ABC transporter substrate-binding protein [Flexilinea flocculi]
MKKRVLLILFCFVLASTLLFAACNTKTEPTAAPVIEETKTVAEVPAAEKSADTSVATDKKSDVKVAMVLSGPINDDDWNSVGYNGLKKACEELGVEFAYSESVTDADAERVIRDYAARGYRLIFAHSFSFGEATLKV